MTIHKDIRVSFLDPFEQGWTEGDVRDKVAGGVVGGNGCSCGFVGLCGGFGWFGWVVWVCVGSLGGMFG
jgi:hypothetical protein